MGTMQQNQTNSGESVLTLASNIAELERLRRFVASFCESEGIPGEICCQLQVVLEELVTNTIRYGGCETKEDAIQLAMRKKGDEVSAVLSDNGSNFNPLDAPSPDLTKSLLDRPVGGLGIHLVRQIMTSIRYERRGNRNYLYLIRSVRAEGAS
jgi:serine/threonine-protein kinase RsbW